MNNKKDYYIYERGNCNKCNLHKPTNYLGICERCDKVSDTDNNVAIKPSTIEQDLDIILDFWFDNCINKTKGNLKKILLEYIQSQRTKDIDEIVGLVDECRWVSGTHFVINGKQEKMISKTELKTKLIELKEKV